MARDSRVWRNAHQHGSSTWWNRRWSLPSSQQAVLRSQRGCIIPYLIYTDSGGREKMKMLKARALGYDTITTPNHTAGQRCTSERNQKSDRGAVVKPLGSNECGEDAAAREASPIKSTVLSFTLRHSTRPPAGPRSNSSSLMLMNAEYAGESTLRTCTGNRTSSRAALLRFHVLFNSIEGRKHPSHRIRSLVSAFGTPCGTLRYFSKTVF